LSKINFLLETPKRVKKGVNMTWKYADFATRCFCFAFLSFLAVHYAHIKTPGQYRGLASDKALVHPWYDASFKL
jgi:hypothetical protein